MSLRIVITASKIAQEGLALLEANGAEGILTGPPGTPEELAAILRAEKPHGLIVRGGQITPAVIDASDRLAAICKHGVGTDNIDIAHATRRGIPVMNTPGANSRSVAELALTLILCAIKQVPRLDHGVRNGVWEKAGFCGTELTGKRLGLVGFGAIGRELTTLVSPFQMEVLAYDPLVPPDAFAAAGVRCATELDDLLVAADVISLHCPLTNATRGLIGVRELALMKPSAILVNAARGGLVDEAALLMALRDGTIAGAGLDAFAAEPTPRDNPLWELRNVVVTPHIGGSTDAGLRNMGVGAARNLLDWLNGRAVDPRCLLNPQVPAPKAVALT